MNLRLASTVGACALLALSAAPGALAQDDAGPLNDLFACRDIAGDAERLACMDAAVDILRADTASGEVVAVDRQEIEEAEASQFGLSGGFGLPDLPRVRMPSLAGGGSETLAETEAAEGEDSAERVVTRNDAGEITSIEGLQIAFLEQNANGRYIIILENGQSWRQTDGTRVNIARRSEPTDLRFEIRSAAMGSFMAVISDTRIGRVSRAFRAERIR